MATSAQKFSKGYKGKSKPKKSRGKEVAGPYRSQSRDPKVRAQATAHEHRRIPPAPSKPKVDLSVPSPTDLTRTKKPTKPELRGLRILRRLAKPTTRPKVPTLTTQKSPQLKGWKPPSNAELEVARSGVEGFIPRSTTGQKIYGKIAEWGPTVLTMGPELKAAAEGLKVGLRGVEAGGEKVGGSALAKPVKVATPSEQAAVSTRLQEKADQALLKRAGAKITGATAKADRAVARQIAGASTRKEAAAAAGAPLKALKVGTLQTLPVVRGHEEALLDNPKKVAKTTLRIAPGVLTTPVGMAADAGLSAGRLTSEALHSAGVPGFESYSMDSVLDPLKGQLDAQKEFLQLVGSVVTSDNPAYVKKQVEDQLGFLLPAMAAPVLARALKPAYARALERFRVKAELSRAERGASRRPLTDEPQHVSRHLENRKLRIEEAKRAATTKAHAQIETAARSKDVVNYARKAKGPKETIRILPHRSRIHGPGAARKVTIHPGDAVGFLARNGISRNVEDGLLQIRLIGERLDPKSVKELPKSKINTADLVAYLERNPEVLKDENLWRAVDHYKDQANSLSTSETARVQPMMHAHADTELGQRNPGLRHFERVPLEVRHLTDATTRDELVKELARDRQRIRLAGLEGDKATARKIAADVKAKTQGLYGELSKAEREQIVSDLADEGITDRAEIRQHLRQARLGKAAHSDKALEREYLEQAEYLRNHFKYEHPAYATQVDVRGKGAPSISAVGAQIPKIPGGEKQRGGKLQEIGAIEESLPSLIRESVRTPVARGHIFQALRDFIDQRAITYKGKTEFTSREAGRMIDDGVFDPRDNILIPRQLYKRAYDQLRREDRGTEEATGEFNQAIDALKSLVGDEQQAGIISALGHERGRKYVIVPREAASEFFAQTDKLSGPQHAVAQLNRVTSRVMLGTSPAWAAMQILAEGAQSAAAVNPYRMARGLRAFQRLPIEKQYAFQAWAGETPGTALAPKRPELGLQDGTMAEASDAFGVANKTWMGRAMKNVSTAELLGILDKRKGGLYRRAVLAGKIDRDLNSKLYNFADGMRQMWRDQSAATEHLKGLPLEQQLEWFADHPEFMKKQQGYLDDVMGNWNALTRHERTAASVVLFYPFLRMSLRWILHGFPKQHPIKAAILYYLGQQNADQLHKLLHGDPSFFNYAMVPLHGGEGGAPNALVDLGRMAPGANALIQGVGDSGGGPAGIVALQAAQPWLASLVTAVTGVSPQGGEQEGSSGAQALAELMSTALPIRLAEEWGAGIVPGQGPSQSRAAKAFRREGGEGVTADVRKGLVPVIPKPLGQERRKVKLGNALDKADRNPVPSPFTKRLIELIFEGKDGKVDLRELRKFIRDRQTGEHADDVASKLEERMSGISYPDLTEEQSKALELALGSFKIPLEGKDARKLWDELRHHNAGPLKVLPGKGSSGGLQVTPRSRGGEELRVIPSHKERGKSSEPQRLIGDLGPEQRQFSKGVAKLTKLSPLTIAAQARAEEGDGAQTEAEGTHNFLNIGPGKSYGSLGEGIRETADLINTGSSYGGIRASRGRGPKAQVAAIEASPWAGVGGYHGLLQETLKEVGVTDAKAPRRVVTRFKAIKQSANQLANMHVPYVYGGGHNGGIPNPSEGLDCSSSTVYLLNKAGVKTPNITSGEFGHYFPSGPGAVTIFYNPTHVFLRIGNKYFGTSVGDSGAGGLGYHPTPGKEYLSQYNVAHVPGLGKKQAAQLGISTSAPQTFPGISISPDGTTATVESGAGTTQAAPGFSRRPIKPTSAQEGLRTLRKLRRLGAGLDEPKKHASTKTKSELERRYGRAAV